MVYASFLIKTKWFMDDFTVLALLYVKNKLKHVFGVLKKLNRGCLTTSLCHILLRMQNFVPGKPIICMLWMIDVHDKLTQLGIGLIFDF